MNTLLLDSFWTNCSAIASTLASLATILYVYFTYKILRETSQTTKLQVKIADAQIYNLITKVLNSPEANDLLDRLEKGNCSIVHVRDFQLQQNNNVIKSSELQRLILDPIEDLAKYRNDGLISLESIDTGFGFKILAVGSNVETVNYIKRLRESYKNKTTYEGLETLYFEIRKLLSETEIAEYPDLFNKI